MSILPIPVSFLDTDGCSRRPGPIANPDRYLGLLRWSGRSAPGGDLSRGRIPIVNWVLDPMGMLRIPQSDPLARRIGAVQSLGSTSQAFPGRSRAAIPVASIRHQGEIFNPVRMFTREEIGGDLPAATAGRILSWHRVFCVRCSCPRRTSPDERCPCRPLARQTETDAASIRQYFVG